MDEETANLDDTSLNAFYVKMAQTNIGLQLKAKDLGRDEGGIVGFTLLTLVLQNEILVNANKSLKTKIDFQNKLNIAILVLLVLVFIIGMITIWRSRK